ncbi:FecCD family ABC transporter permease [Pseudosulfitobacter pseudonitzschiae]|uniref:FecCD family ABC transporter permease n=1 Tax=Pseudosulfitobacter pseudonitzschiae TaxID=1402135 RepID=UPI003BA0E3AB
MLLLCLASLLFGARPDVGLPELGLWLRGANPKDAATIVLHEMRLPRTLVAVLAGGALGVAGTTIQALARNPLADPGLLGLNAGAAFAIVVTVYVLGPLPAVALAVPAAVGAGIAALCVTSIGAMSSNPVTLVLAGAALTALLNAALRGLILLDPLALDAYRHWALGAVDQTGFATLAVGACCALTGLALALLVARWLDVLALGSDTALALGARVGRIRLAGLLATTLLSAAAVMVAGPIAFIGLLAPHMARMTGAARNSAIMMRAGICGAALLLVADIAGRLVFPGLVIEAGLGVTLIGGPAMVWLVRRQAQGLK